MFTSIKKSLVPDLGEQNFQLTVQLTFPPMSHPDAHSKHRHRKGSTRSILRSPLVKFSVDEQQQWERTRTHTRRRRWRSSLVIGNGRYKRVSRDELSRYNNETRNRATLGATTSTKVNGKRESTNSGGGIPRIVPMRVLFMRRKHVRDDDCLLSVKVAPKSLTVMRLVIRHHLSICLWRAYSANETCDRISRWQIRACVHASTCTRWRSSLCTYLTCM